MGGGVSFGFLRAFDALLCPGNCTLRGFVRAAQKFAVAHPTHSGNLCRVLPPFCSSNFVLRELFFFSRIQYIYRIASALNPNIKVTKVALPMVIQAEMMHRLPKFSLW